MKLYYLPGACSLTPHIVAEEVGIALELDKVDFETGRTASGEVFAEVNPKGSVPVLRLDNGEVLTEGPVIAQYLADQKPERGLIPAFGSLERYRVEEMQGFINSEVHKPFGALFHPSGEAEQQACRAALQKAFALLERRLAAHEWLAGDRYSVADAYLFNVAGWAKFVSFDLSGFPALGGFLTRVAKRPAVQAAMRAEGLL